VTQTTFPEKVLCHALLCVSRKRRAQSGTGFVDPVMGIGHAIKHTGKAMDHSCCDGRVNIHARFCKSRSISHSFVAQGIEFGGDDSRWGQSREAFRVQHQCKRCLCR